ncbi:MAG: hypothetical protein Q4E33_03280 [Erysipelotrichaceae bacterium]|nr:hypothetical protein [Erysipelotrichaceae bacterium]
MKALKKIFIILETIIFLSFIIMDINNIDSSYLKYTGIILCFIYNIVSKNVILSLALLFTLISDYFLLLTNNHILIGLLTFIIVQLLYMYFLSTKNINNLYSIRIGLYLLLTIICIILKTNLETILALLYFSSLVMNTICSYQNKKLLIYSIGLTLFIGCDINVGLHNIMNVGTIYQIATIMMWIFYLPSQVLISIGGNKNVES